MKKRVLGCVLGAAVAGLAALTLTSCDNKDVFHIYAWNDEFQGFFNKYLVDEKADFVAAAKLEKEGKKEEAAAKRPSVTHLDGKEVKWTIVPSENGAYQEALDKALAKNAKASKGKKVDLFLAEADYILKYGDSDLTQDISKIGVTNQANIYNYTKQAASDSKGVCKGVSFQCCPAGVIYRRSIAEDLFGASDPETVQSKIDTWAKFDAVAAQAKTKGYYMTASFAETYRAFSNNVTKPWVDSNNKLQFDSQISAWMDQADLYVKNGYTLTAGVWDTECTNEMAKTGKAFCYFGPAWYYNFCMGPAQDKDTGCYGDWGLVTGPAKYFWGGTWLLAPTGTDDEALVAKTMNAFINDETVCTNLVKEEGQFSNNQKVNAAVAAEYDAAGTGNEFLGGQNDTKLYLELAKGIKFENQTIYDQYCNEGLQNKFVEYLKNPTAVSKETAIANFKAYINEKCPTVKTA